MKLSTFAADMRGLVTAGQLVDQVREAADLGLVRVWFAQAFGWDALTAAAVGGAGVPTIGLGTAVVAAPQRHPLVLASQALSVQAAVGGRLTLGVGAGVGLMLRSSFGLPDDRPARRMREYLTVLRPLLRGDTVEHRGELLTAAGTVQVPDAAEPRVLLAALGPAMLRLAGELAEGTVTWMTGPRTLSAHVVPSVVQAAEASGRPSPSVVAALPVCVTDDEAGARTRIDEWFGIATTVAEYRAMFEREGVAGPGEVALVGDQEAVAHQLARLRDAGVTEFVAAPFGTPHEQSNTLRALAQLAPGCHMGSA